MKALFKKGDILEDMHPSEPAAKFIKIIEVKMDYAHPASKTPVVIYLCEHGRTINGISETHKPLRRTQKYIKSFCKQIIKE